MPSRSFAALSSTRPALGIAAGEDFEDTGIFVRYKRNLFFWVRLTQSDRYYDPTRFTIGMGDRAAVLVLEDFK